MFWGIIVFILLCMFINYILSGENDESTVKDLNLNWKWKRKPFDPDTYEPSSLHGDKYDEDE